MQKPLLGVHCKVYSVKFIMVVTCRFKTLVCLVSAAKHLVGSNYQFRNPEQFLLKAFYPETTNCTIAHLKISEPPGGNVEICMQLH